jgi:hypothetical protein
LDYLVYEELRYNDAVFSAFRAHAMQHEIAGQLLDGDGKLKPFSDFFADVKSIVEPRWLDGWLETEYNTAVVRAHLAADWRQFEDNKDVLPNLRWMPTTSAHPAADHAIYWINKVTRPVDDPFWGKHRPGDRWNCKCGLEATDDPVTSIPGETGDDKDKPSPGLQNNPAKDGKLFGDKHPYIANAYPGAKGAVARLLEDEGVVAPEPVKETRYKGGGLLQVEGKQNGNEAKKNLAAYTILAKAGDKYRLLAVINESGRKNPDALNLSTKEQSDAKTPTTKNLRNAIQNSVKAAEKQGAQEVVIRLPVTYNADDVRGALMTAFQEGRRTGIKHVVLIFKDDEIRRYDADYLRKIFSQNS